MGRVNFVRQNEIRRNGIRRNGYKPTSVQRAFKFSVDRLGYESPRPEQETVWEFLSDKDVFAVKLPTAMLRQT